MKDLFFLVAVVFLAPVASVAVLVLAPIVAAVVAPFFLIVAAVFPVLCPAEWNKAKNGGF